VQSRPQAAAAPQVFAGTWKLDAAQSRVEPAAGLAGLIGAGAPPMLHITQPANGTVVVESPINEGHVRMYHPGAKTATPVGQGGTITMTTQWANKTLVSEGAAVAPNGVSSAIKEMYALSADGTALTIDITTSTPEAKSSSLKYVRIVDVGPCESWPTPCKRAK
jgi:hypothetical protein